MTGQPSGRITFDVTEVSWVGGISSAEKTGVEFLEIEKRKRRVDVVHSGWSYSDDEATRYKFPSTNLGAITGFHRHIRNDDGSRDKLVFEANPPLLFFPPEPPAQDEWESTLHPPEGNPPRYFTGRYLGRQRVAGFKGQFLKVSIAWGFVAGLPHESDQNWKRTIYWLEPGTGMPVAWKARSNIRPGSYAILTATRRAPKG